MQSILDRVARRHAYRLPIKPTRVALKPEAPFGEGLEDPPGPSCPIDRRNLPRVDGWGLEQHESWKINAAFNAAFADHALDNPNVPLTECDAVARVAAKAELVRVLKKRPPAPPLRTRPVPPEVTTIEDVPARSPNAPKYVRCRTHDRHDELWWAMTRDREQRGISCTEAGDEQPTTMAEWLEQAAPCNIADFEYESHDAFLGHMAQEAEARI